MESVIPAAECKFPWAGIKISYKNRMKIMNAAQVNKNNQPQGNKGLVPLQFLPPGDLQLRQAGQGFKKRIRHLV